MFVEHRASKSCKCADAHLRKIVKNLRKMCTFESKIGKAGRLTNNLAQYD